MKKFTRQHPTDPNLFWCPGCQTYKGRDEFNKGGGPWKINSPCKTCRYPQNKKKICELCGSEFSVITLKRKYCQGCQKTKKHEWDRIGYLRHREERIAKTKIYVADNCDIVRERKHRHYLKNKAVISRKNETWRAKNKERVNANSRKWAFQNREKSRLIKKKYEKNNPDKRHASVLRIARKYRENIDDNYVRKVLRQKGHEPTPELIEMQRQSIVLHRSINQLKEVSGWI